MPQRGRPEQRAEVLRQVGLWRQENCPGGQEVEASTRGSRGGSNHNIPRKCWGHLADFGTLWETLEDFERFWETLRGFGRFVKLAVFSKEVKALTGFIGHECLYKRPVNSHQLLFLLSLLGILRIRERMGTEKKHVLVEKN